MNENNGKGMPMPPDSLLVAGQMSSGYPHAGSEVPAGEGAPDGAVGRIRALTGRLGRAPRRFPVAFALIAVSVLLLMVIDVASIAYSTGDFPFGASRLPDPFELLGRIARSCLASAPASVVATLVCERRRYKKDPIQPPTFGQAVGQSIPANQQEARVVPQALAEPASTTRGAGSLVPQVLVALIMFGLASALGYVIGEDSTFWWMMYGAAFVVPAFLGLWLLYTPENEDALLPVVICGLWFASFVASVLMGGLIGVLAAFEALIHELSFEFFTLISTACWVGVFPMVFLALLPQVGEGIQVPRAWRIIAGYVVFPLFLALLGVLYLYLGRIALTHTMPSGEMNWFGSFALLACLTLWASIRMMGNAPTRLFLRFGWVLLVPVTAVQLYGVYVRLSAYGLTPLRYASLACTVVGIVGLVLFALGRSPRHFCLIAAVAAFVVLVSPANALDMANLNQAHRFSSAFNTAAAGEQLTERQLEQADSAWAYLHGAERGYFDPDGAIAQAHELSYDDLAATLGVSSGDYGGTDADDSWDVWDDDHMRYLWADCVPTPLDVAGYTTVIPIEPFTESIWVSEDGIVTATVVPDADHSYTIDLTEVANQLAAGELPGEAHLDSNGWRLPDGGIALRLEGGDIHVIVTSLGVTLEDDQITEVEADGYLLVP